MRRSLLRVRVLKVNEHGFLPVMGTLLMMAVLVSSCVQGTPVASDGTIEPPTAVTEPATEPSTAVTEPATEPSPPATEPPTEVTEPPTDITEPAPTGIPEGSTKCDFSEGTFVCTEVLNHQIKIADTPPDATPYLLALPDDKAQDLRNAPREGTECIFAVVADLAFYDSDGKLVREFPEKPVSISFTFTDDELVAFEGCKKSIIANTPDTEVDYLPVYFTDQWRPFPPDSYETDGNTVTVYITSWGDRPLGGGTKP